jgi:hypothetical protein
MNIKDLRIGNLVYSKTYSKEIEMKSFYGLCNVESNPELFEPIPLTEKWLKKLGFGKSDEHEMGNNLNDNFGFYYDYHFKRFRLECSDDDGLNYADMDLKINYVHQLQNLYFYLTGDELTIA